MKATKELIPKDMNRTLGNMRLTDTEKVELLLALAEDVKPKAKDKHLGLVHIAETWDASDRLMRNGDEIIGLSSGYPSVDKLTRGMREGQLITIFGDTGHGKSLLVQNIALRVASAGIPVFFIALEMINEENTERFRTMGLTDRTLPILYPEQNDLEYTDIDKLVEQAVAEGVKLVIIDHLHMFDFSGYAREDIGITAVVKEFKMIAQRHRVPVIMVAHIKERTEQESVKPPKMRDLKGSSSIKQLSDTAIAIWNRGEVEVTTFDELTLVLHKGRTGKKHTRAYLPILSDMRLAEKSFQSG